MSSNIGKVIIEKVFIRDLMYSSIAGGSLVIKRIDSNCRKIAIRGSGQGVVPIGGIHKGIVLVR